jgi:hypothetical protein
MKSNLLFITVACAGLCGVMSAQTSERRLPGDSGYGFRERPVAANMVTPEQLTHWMQGSIGSNSATADQWCYAMSKLVPGGYTCPPPDQFGFAGRERNATVDAQTFLNNLRAYQTGGSPPPYATEGTGRVEVSPGVRACRHEVEERLRADGYSQVQIPSINSEDRPGGADRVYGWAEAQSRFGRSEHFDFSCAVNLERGDVHSVDLNPR